MANQVVNRSSDDYRQAVLRSSQLESLQALLAKLPAGAYLCDSDGLITYFNDHAVGIWGRAPELNNPVDRFCGSFKLYSSDGKPIAHDECWMALALKTGKEYNGQEIVIECPDRIRRTVLAHANPIYDEAGNLQGAVNVLVDISDRKLAEEVNARLSAIVESAEDAIISKTLDGVIRSWNAGAERLFGYSANEAIGQSITLIIPPERLDEEQLILSRLRRGERIEHYETVRMSKDGQRFDISLTISPIQDLTGRIIGASKVARDITTRKQSEATLVALKNQLEEAHQRKDEFLAMLAHELRNPLAVIDNSLQLLRLDDSLSPSVEKLREIMEQQTNHLTRLVEDLLDASRITRGSIELRWEAVDLASVVANAVQTARPLIDDAGHQLAVALPPTPVILNADPVRLTQVLGNLLTNAAKYTPHGGQIWLTGRRKDGGAQLSVRDTGLGIPADMLPHIFDMFAQVESSLSRARGGMGLGLALAKKLVELHGGRIEVHSAGHGKGSEFVVWLPTAVSAQLYDPCRAPVLNRTSAAAPRKVLVVDDMNAAAFVLSSLLTKLGHHVETARHAAAALEAVDQQRPDIVFSDIGMPDIDGYELARRLRQMPELAGVVLVALTGYGQERDRQKTVEAGFDYHLVKPVSLDALQDLLASLPPVEDIISPRGAPSDVR
ncbi:MAG: PAS domain S-box protein [Pirellulales bacterium]